MSATVASETVASETGVTVASETSVSGASETGASGLTGVSAGDETCYEKYDLSRRWRHTRSHASHDPVIWKYRHVGNCLLNDVTPPNHGQI
jgi:hypothetical protein